MRLVVRGRASGRGARPRTVRTAPRAQSRVAAASSTTPADSARAPTHTPGREVKRYTVIPTAAMPPRRRSVPYATRRVRSWPMRMPW